MWQETLLLEKAKITLVSKENLYLCMGSACHQLGVYDVLPKIQALLAQHQFEIVVELKGAFCLGPCSDGIVIRFGDKFFTKLTAHNVEQRFIQEILPCLKGLKE